MLQSELLTEEHNYAKEEWPLPNLQYKTEKVEGAEVATEPAPPQPLHRSCPTTKRAPANRL